MLYVKENNIKNRSPNDPKMSIESNSAIKLYDPIYPKGNTKSKTLPGSFRASITSTTVIIHH